MKRTLPYPWEKKNPASVTGKQSSSAQRGQQVGDLVIDTGRVIGRAADFLGM